MQPRSLPHDNVVTIVLVSYKAVLSYLKVVCANVQPVAHIQKVWHTLVVQQDINRYRATGGSIHQVLQNMWICDHVHHYCYQLQFKKRLIV